MDIKRNDYSLKRYHMSSLSVLLPYLLSGKVFRLV